MPHHPIGYLYQWIIVLGLWAAFHEYSIAIFKAVANAKYRPISTGNVSSHHVFINHVGVRTLLVDDNSLNDHMVSTHMLGAFVWASGTIAFRKLATCMRASALNRRLHRWIGRALFLSSVTMISAGLHMAQSVQQPFVYGALIVSGIILMANIYRLGQWSKVEKHRFWAELCSRIRL